MATEVKVDSNGSLTYFIDGTQVSRDDFVVELNNDLGEVETAEYFAEEAAQAEAAAVSRAEQKVLEKEARNANNLTSVEFNEDGTQNYFVNGQQVDYATYEDAGGKEDPTTEDLEAQDAQDALDTEAYEELQAEQQYAKDVQESEARKIAEDDWRVRLHLAPDANYLYKATDPGILAPLNDTNGIIFPYTPQIAVQYNANYENYDLTHSNYRGYFYTGSQTQNILLTATFTANDVAEANYMLAALHFLRSATKMFYGQDDANRGMPPPVVFLTGLGEYQFNNHPCAITMMNYNLPNDVDYIPCGKPEGIAILPPAKVPANSTASARLSQTNLTASGIPKAPVNSATTQGQPDPYTKATYVPTKIEINFTMIPIQTRDQVSKEFSLKDYASGDLLKKGFW